MCSRYTLRNAEYRLCLERNLDIHEGDTERQSQCNSKLDLQGAKEQDARTNEFSAVDTNFGKTKDDLSNNIGIQGLGEMSPEAKRYIIQLQSHLAAVKKVFLTLLIMS